MGLLTSHILLVIWAVLYRSVLGPKADVLLPAVPRFQSNTGSIAYVYSYASPWVEQVINTPAPMTLALYVKNVVE